MHGKEKCLNNKQRSKMRNYKIHQIVFFLLLFCALFLHPATQEKIKENLAAKINKSNLRYSWCGSGVLMLRRGASLLLDGAVVLVANSARNGFADSFDTDK